MITDWIYRTYCDIFKHKAKIKYYTNNNAFEISFGRTFQNGTIRVLVIDGKIAGSVYGSSTFSFLTKGKDWDSDGNLIENSNIGDIL